MEISYDRIDTFEKENEPSRAAFKAYLESEDYDAETVQSILEEYGYVQ